MNRALSLLTCLLPCLAMAELRTPSDQELQRAIREGAVRPFNEVMKQARTLPGELLRVDLQEDQGRWIYELKMLDRTQNVIKVGYRADTLRMIYLRGHHLEYLFDTPAQPDTP
ncbi:PepSY domain-containing protein [Aeromonas simiae]|uniref:PepSY domain-containing protein n=1 Tax=Aeromonas simiae TaxID=218936 RepID=UPI0005A96D9B|nr:hypothetical protein [Aeromonas simiae]MDO2948172.1 hypothetical protein [Aeromonas simiae]MDO2951653.1 hypothetical protein [Aeromonas simiae]MDO2955639.1 hypothetical protein [Aeromonas simiae]